MDRKKKKYLQNDDAPLTNYMKSKFRRLEIADQSEKILSNTSFDQRSINSNSSEPTNVHDTDVPAFSNEYSENHAEKIINDNFIEIQDNSSVAEPMESANECTFNLSSKETNKDCTLSDDCYPVSLETLIGSYNDSIQFSEKIVEDLYDSDDDVLNILRIDTESKSLHQLKDEEGFFESLSTRVDLSPGELLLTTLKFSLVNNLSFTAMTNLLRFVNCICGKNVLPETRYMIDKLLNNEDNVTFHGVCPSCSNYFGTFENMQKCIECTECATNSNVANPSDTCYFSMLDPSNAIRDYLQSNQDYYDFVIKERIHKKNVIEDIYDGKLYRKFVKNLADAERYNYVTVTFNTDGAPVFESSKFSIWPIYLCINEIPIQNRFDSIIVAGLWFGKSKPEMDIFLDIFVESMNCLSVTGIECTIKNEIRCIKLYAIAASVDTIARAPMNGSRQFNAHYGCDWCLDYGEYFAGSMRYPYLKEPSESRNEKNTHSFAKEALRINKAYMGINTASPLLKLHGFEVIKSFTPEYMHCYLAGVGKQYTEYLINHMSTEDFNEINNMLTKIRVPHQLGRLSRSLKDRGDWKAREWENWLLYYSIPLLKNRLKSEERLKHWSLLTTSLHIALQTNISSVDLKRLEEMLKKFVSEAENLYDLSAMTYNTHQLLHIVESIKNWGPLWAHSAFCFESANHKLLRAIKSAKGVIQQIIRKINLERSVQVLEKMVHPHCSPIVSQFCENVNVRRVKKIFKPSNIVYFSKGKTVDDFLCQKFNVSRVTKAFHKMILNNCLYTTDNKINLRSCNYFAQSKSGEFVKLILFLADSEKNEEITICKVIKSAPNKYSDAVNEVIEIKEDLIAINTNDIRRICVYIETPFTNYITPVPNLIAY